MNIDLIMVGKTDSEEVESLLAMYAKRINRYCRFTVTTLADVRNTRNMAPNRQKQLEGEAILRGVGDGDCLALMDAETHVERRETACDGNRRPLRLLGRGIRPRRHEAVALAHDFLAPDREGHLRRAALPRIHHIE